MIKPCTCKHCNQDTNLNLIQRICSPHLFGKWYFYRCQHCGRISWLKYKKHKGDK